MPTQPPAAPLVTVVVPTRNSARTIERCLRSVVCQTDRYGRPLPLELVVVDNHSTDGTHAIARRFADRVISAGPERSAQRNLGAATGTAAVVAFIDSDQILEPTVAFEALELLDGDAELGVVVVPERSFGEGFWARGRSLERRLADGDPRSEAGRFYRRATLDAIGGFDERLTGPEDWELHDRTAAAGWATGRTTAQIDHDEGRISLRASFAKKRYYGRGFVAYRRLPWARRGAFNPRRLALHPTLLWSDPLAVTGLVVLKGVEAAGAGLGIRTGRRLRDSTSFGPAAVKVATGRTDIGGRRLAGDQSEVQP